MSFHLFTYVRLALKENLQENKAVYTAFVAPRRPKSKSVTYGPTDQRTDGRTHALKESLHHD